MKNDQLIRRIQKWNLDRGLIKKGFNHELEAAFIIEELLESFGYAQPKEISREFAKALATRSNVACNGVVCEKTFDPTLGDILDAWGDILVYNVGGLCKLTFEPTEVVNEIMDKNDAKGSKTDAAGKIVKDDSFIEPNMDKFL